MDWKLENEHNLCKKVLLLAYLSITFIESSFSLIDSDALTIPSKQRAIIGATDASTSAAPLMNSFTPLVRFSSISCSLLKTYKKQFKDDND